MISIQLRSKVRASDVQEMLGKHVDASHYDTVVTGDATVFKPDGSRLLTLRKNVLDPAMVDEALPHLLSLKTFGGSSDLRGAYAGGIPAPWVKKDGTVATAMRIRDPATGERMFVYSHVAGYFDRYPRFPYCRETAFTAHEVDRFAVLANGLVQRVAQVFEETIPDRFLIQSEMAAKTSKDFVIKGTPYTTLTINNTVRAACHYDSGDLKEGFGCLTAHRTGRFNGFLLVFPEWRCAVDVQHRDVLFFDSHDMHANTAMEKIDDAAERVSVVYYYRKKMIECGTAEQERQRASTSKGTIE